MMKVHFLLPTDGVNPVGGYKVVYEYANGLADRGHDVRVTHPLLLHPQATRELKHPRRWLTYAHRLVRRRYTPDSWFKVDRRVTLRYVPTLHEAFIGRADILVATSWETAAWAHRYAPQAGRKFYLIQHFEDWSGPKDEVLATWRLPLCKIVIARWLQEMADAQGEPSIYVPNGLDAQAFGQDRPHAERPAASVVMLYHEAPWKGSADGLAALEMARRRCPDLVVDLFGVPPPPPGLPTWVRYHRQPSPSALRALYNGAALCLGPSLTEGWGLPPAEAMLCGCAVVMTDIGGHREFGIPGQTALMVPPGSAAAMADAIVSLVEDGPRRLRLAQEGCRHIRQFTWQRAVGAFEAALLAASEEKKQ